MTDEALPQLLVARHGDSHPRDFMELLNDRLQRLS
jgi:hypothetical protein